MEKSIVFLAFVPDAKGKLVPFMTKDEDGNESQGRITVEPKNFKTGSRGYHGQAKLEFNGERHQSQVQLTVIGSKKEPRVDAATIATATAADARNKASMGVETAPASNGKQPDVNIITALASQPAALQAYLASFK